MSDITRYGLPLAGGLPVSKAVAADGWLYVTGQVPRKKNGDILVGGMAEQARLCFENLCDVLKLAEYDLKHVVRVGVWIDDPRDFPEFNKIFAGVFAPNDAPARVTIQSTLMCDCKVEVDAVAYKRPPKI